MVMGRPMEGHSIETTNIQAPMAIPKSWILKMYYNTFKNDVNGKCTIGHYK